MIKEIINRMCLVVHWIGFIIAVILIPMGFYYLFFGDGFQALMNGFLFGGGPFFFCWMIRFILTGRRKLVPWK